jgi:hypothetical protein
MINLVQVIYPLDLVPSSRTTPSAAKSSPMAFIFPTCSLFGWLPVWPWDWCVLLFGTQTTLQWLPRLELLLHMSSPDWGSPCKGKIRDSSRLVGPWPPSFLELDSASSLPSHQLLLSRSLQEALCYRWRDTLEEGTTNCSMDLGFP